MANLLQQTIESKDMNLGDLFKDFYAVPNYQREYIWEEKQVEQLMEDIYYEYSENVQAPAPDYFIGNIVICPGPEDVFELIDGQQRLTTAFLFFCALRDRLQELDAKAIDLLKTQIAATDIDEKGNNVYRHRLDLQYDDSRQILKIIAEGIDDINEISNDTRSVNNIINAYSVIKLFLAINFKKEVSELRKFYAFFTKNVKLVRIKTLNINHALKVFETINDRGVGLDAMDLLKNLLFMNANRDDFDQLNDRWKQLIDKLYQGKEKPLRFLRYYIFANFDVERLREDEIYSWFVKNKEESGIDKNPIKFVDILSEAADAYIKFLNGQYNKGNQNRYLSNLGFLSGSARQHLIILLAGRHLKIDLFNELCKQLENLFFGYIITREPTREFERRFALWPKDLRKVTTQKQLQKFIIEKFEPAKESISARFGLAFEEFHEEGTPKYRLKYVLAKIAQYIDESCKGSNSASADLKTYINADVEIEHILPQSPQESIVGNFDNPDEIEDYIRRLGNLTLIEKSLNASGGNKPYEEKMTIYKSSDFLITKSLVTKISVGKNTSYVRVAKKLMTFDIWDSETIHARQKMLKNLSFELWDIPTSNTD